MSIGLGGILSLKLYKAIFCLILYTNFGLVAMIFPSAQLKYFPFSVVEMQVVMVVVAVVVIVALVTSNIKLSTKL